MNRTVCFAFIAICIAFVNALDYARLIEPPPRGSLPGGRLPKPELYKQSHPLELDCGGIETQWLQNEGKCGLCGDAYDGVRNHEVGGLFPTSPVIREYQTGQVMKTKVENGKNMEGWMEFILCVKDDTQEITTECTEQHILQLADGSGTRFYVTKHMRMIKVGVELPADVTCNKCVLQWHYRTEMRVGLDDESGRECKGCGAQTEYYNCADIVIHAVYPGNNVRTKGNFTVGLHI